MYGTHVKRGKPDMFLKKESGPQGSPIAWPVQDGGRSKGQSVIDWIEGAPNAATFPRAKARRLPPGLSARERLTNRLRR
jgi:hypothetical protein